MKENLKPELKVLSNSKKSICFPVNLLILMHSFGGEIIFVSNQNVTRDRWVDRNIGCQMCVAQLW